MTPDAMPSSGDVSPGTVDGASRAPAAVNGVHGGAQQPPAAANGLKATARKKPPGGFDATPLADAPPGYTVRFCFRCAANLPPADFHTRSSDPFLTATLRAANPKRHKEDPDLVHRTPTLRRTTEPAWNDEWVVANVPPSGFSLKCRLYDEDAADRDDRLGNVTVDVLHVFDQWEGLPPPGKEFEARKRIISKRAFLLKGLTSILHSGAHITPRLTISIEVLGRSDPPHAQMYTLGPTTWIRHFSPMIGRLTGTKVNANEDEDRNGSSSGGGDGDGTKARSQKYE